MTEEKYCKDCKHFIPATYTFGHKVGDWCVRPQLPRDLVTGKRAPVRPSLQRTMAPVDSCGPSGKYFEPIERKEN